MNWDDLLKLKGGTLFDTRPDVLLRRLQGEPVPLIACFGGGVNSTAGLVLFHKINLCPDAILFADTGEGDSEKPETYAHVALMSQWCQSVGFPAITTVRRSVDHDRQKHADKYNTLEQECRVKKCLPSIAYYHRSCSQKWKHAPQDKWANAWPQAQDWWTRGEKVIKAIFYDADEPERASIQSSNDYQFWHPLLDYDWGRAECETAIRLAGLPLPPKSSCFYCPESTPREIFELRDQHPELLERALAMEQNAVLTGILGLGKHEYSWRDLLDGKVSLTVIQKANGDKKLPCMCYDG